MNDAIPAARRLALVGYNDALRASDATRLEMNYLVTTASANTTLEKRITSLFGSFQMATRRSMASENFDSDVLEDFYDSEVDWSIQTNRLRQQCYAANGSAKNAYNVALRSAATTRQTNLLNAAAKYNVDVFNAEEIYAKATAAADSVRTLTSFDSTAAYIQSTLRAIGDKLYRNAADDAFFDGEQWELDEQTLNSIAMELAAVRNAACLTDEHGETVLKSGSDVANDFASISTAFTNIAASISAFDTRTEEYAASSETTSEDSTGGSETTSSVASRRGARAESNQNLYDSAISVANAAYVESVRSSQNDWTLAYLDSLATRNESISTVGSAYQKTQKKAQDSFFFSVAKASTNYSDVTIQNTQTLTYNQEQIDLFGVSVPLSGIFANPTRDYEVCFVAGTPVLMADGTKRPIESIRPGDMVLAANHLEPTSKPVPAKVVRFFDNGEKDVVRLHIGDEEILCTPEHPFYVVGKGWVCAQELAFGDMCLNADGESVAFVSREAIEGKLRVYNFEVERKHTYFVGDNGGLLAHNDCFMSAFWSEYSSVLCSMGKGAMNAVKEPVLYAVDVVGVSADAVVTFAGACTGNNWSLNYHELSDAGQYYNSIGPSFSNPDFVLTVGINSCISGAAAISFGATEIIRDVWAYSQTGDGNALAEHMGSLAAGNLLIAAGASRNTIMNAPIGGKFYKIKFNPTFSDYMKPNEAIRYDEYWSNVGKEHVFLDQMTPTESLRYQLYWTKVREEGVTFSEEMSPIEAERYNNYWLGVKEEQKQRYNERFIRDPKFLDENGDVIWPPNDGAVLGTSRNVFLEKGGRISRFGKPRGSYASPEGIAYEARSLPYVMEEMEYHVYEVCARIKAIRSTIAPWFDQMGGGIQYRLEESIDYLMEHSILKEVYPSEVVK